jgi:G:T-mismatch repair DNA endonuclease (very short patch repair protein)
VEKFQANVARDERAVRDLNALDYYVLTLWECEAETPSVLSARLHELQAAVRKREPTRPR